MELVAELVEDLLQVALVDLGVLRLHGESLVGLADAGVDDGDDHALTGVAQGPGGLSGGVLGGGEHAGGDSDGLLGGSTGHQLEGEVLHSHQTGDLVDGVDHPLLAGEAEAVEQQAVVGVDLDLLVQSSLDAGLSPVVDGHLGLEAVGGQVQVTGLHVDGVLGDAHQDGDGLAVGLLRLLGDEDDALVGVHDGGHGTGSQGHPAVPGRRNGGHGEGERHDQGQSQGQESHGAVVFHFLHSFSSFSPDASGRALIVCNQTA